MLTRYSKSHNFCLLPFQNAKSATVVKLTVVPCPPVVEVKIKRPDTKYQLGFSVQNGVVSVSTLLNENACAPCPSCFFFHFDRFVAYFEEGLRSGEVYVSGTASLKLTGRVSWLYHTSASSVFWLPRSER